MFTGQLSNRMSGKQMDSLQGYEFSISRGNEAEVVKVDIPIIGGGVIPLRIHLILGSQEVGCRTRQWGEHLLTSCGFDLALNVTSSEKPSLIAQFTVLSHHSGSPLPAVALSSEYPSLLVVTLPPQTVSSLRWGLCLSFSFVDSSVSKWSLASALSEFTNGVCRPGI